MKLGGPLAIAAALILTGCASAPPPVSDQVASYYEANASKKPTIAADPAIPVVNISRGLLAPATRVLIFGDSWTQGTAAATPDKGYAPLLGQRFGWANDVQGGSGTGYLNAGTAKIGTFSERIASLPEDKSVQLVLIQGGINDQEKDLKALPGAASAVFAEMQTKFPAAQLVVFGPAAHTIPVTPKLAEVDRLLKSSADKAKLPYISPIAERWITPANYASYIDVAAAQHPSTDGHAFLAQKVAEALEAIAK